MYKNHEGYSDPTAGKAMSKKHKHAPDPLMDSEIAREEELTNSKIIKSFRKLCALNNFEIVGRITLRSKKTGRIFR